MILKTGDLSKILDVSTNTIRRFGKMGYLKEKVNEENGYHEFDYGDVERLMYVAKYRREEIPHEEVAGLIELSTAADITEIMEERRLLLQKEIARLKAAEHMLKDDIMLIRRAEDMEGQMLDMPCQPFHYVIYQKGEKLLTGGKRGEALHEFMQGCPEFLYMYLFEKADVENGCFRFSEGVGANKLMTEKYQVNISEFVESYEICPCVLRFIKAPLDIINAHREHPEKMWELFFSEVFEYMRAKDLRLAGDVIVLKVGLVKDKEDMQYLLMHYPVEQI